MPNKNARVVIYWSGKIHDLCEVAKERSLTSKSNNQGLFAGLKLLIPPDYVEKERNQDYKKCKSPALFLSAAAQDGW